MSNGASTGATEPSHTVLDAGPIIHLDQLGCLDLLEGFASLFTPAVVWEEAQRHRPQLRPSQIAGLKVTDSPLAPSPALMTLARSLDLDAGEIAALSLLESMRGRTFLCDDAAARLAGESLGYIVHGTMGVIVRAIRRGTRTAAEAGEILQRLPARSTLHINPDLLRRVIAALPS